MQHGHYRESRTFLERVLASSEQESTSLRARALWTAADLAIMRGDLAQVMLLGRQSLALYRELGDVRGSATCLLNLGRFAWRTGKTTEAIARSVPTHTSATNKSDCADRGHRLLVKWDPPEYDRSGN